MAVAYAHSEGLVHRDIKPENVVLGDFGETAVLDWGLAKIRGQASPRDRQGEDGPRLQAAEALTRVGSKLGTPEYMSPEAARGSIDQVKEASDVWGLGAVLYTVLCDHEPYSGDEAEVLAQFRSGRRPRPIDEFAPDAPDVLVSLVQAALSLDPSRRPTAEQFSVTQNRFSRDVSEAEATKKLSSSYSKSQALWSRRCPRDRSPRLSRQANFTENAMFFAWPASSRIHGSGRTRATATQTSSQRRPTAPSEYGLFLEKVPSESTPFHPGWPPRHGLPTDRLGRLAQPCIRTRWVSGPGQALGSAFLYTPGSLCCHSWQLADTCFSMCRSASRTYTTHCSPLRNFHGVCKPASVLP